jgi:hypothetical protein
MPGLAFSDKALPNKHFSQNFILVFGVPNTIKNNNIL